MGSGIDQTGRCGWQDPRTGLCFETQSIARSLGYDQPVDVGATIVQVGSQGSFTKDGKLVTESDLTAAGANNAGYVTAAAVNLQQNPTSDAQSAFNSFVNYQMTGSYTDPNAKYVRAVPDHSIVGEDSPYMQNVRNTGPHTSPDPISPIVSRLVSPASASADPSIGTGGSTTRGGILQSFGGYILMIVIIIVGLLIIFRGKVTGNVG